MVATFQRYRVGNQGIRFLWNLLYLSYVMVLMRPGLEGRWILFVHHTYALENHSLDLQGRELLLESFDELLAVPVLASSLEVIDVRTQDEY